MGIKEYFISKKETPQIGLIGGVEIKEQFKGVVNEEEKFKMDKSDGEEHPFNFKDTIGLYKSFPMVAGAVDKLIDFTVGPGIFVKSENESAQELIQDFIKDGELNLILRSLLRDALITGNGFLELGKVKEGLPEGFKILPPNTMFVKRDEVGEIQGYVQIVGKLSGKKVEFKPNEIAHLKNNVVSSEAYGIGIIYPCLDIINKLLKAQKDMQTLLERKANSPYHIKIGNIEKDIMPSQSDVDAAAQRLSSLKANQEWVTDANWDIKVVETGNSSEKFVVPIDHYQNLLFMGLQVPEVLMGLGNIPEGLAKTQMDAFERKVKSIQDELEKIVESQIFRVILDSNGFTEEQVEIEWGQPSEDDKRAEIQMILQLLGNQSISPTIKKAVELRLADLLDLKLDGPLEQPEEEPEQENKPEEQEEHLHEHFTTDEIPVMEWCNYSHVEERMGSLGINRQQFLDKVLERLRRYRFAKVTDKERGDIKIMRSALTTAFKENKSIASISRDLIKNGFTDKDAKAIARTETIRVSNNAALDIYEEKDIEVVEFVSTSDERTDEICSELNGELYSVSEARGVIPDETHPNCRCVFKPYRG